MPNIIISWPNEYVHAADDVIANEYENEYDIGYVNAGVFEYGNETVNANDHVYVCENVYDNE